MKEELQKTESYMIDFSLYRQQSGQALLVL